MNTSKSFKLYKWLHLCIKGIQSWIFPLRIELCLHKQQKIFLLLICKICSLLKTLINVRERAFMSELIDYVQKQIGKNREGNWQQFNMSVKIKQNFCWQNTINIYFYSWLCLIFCCL